MKKGTKSTPAAKKASSKKASAKVGITEHDGKPISGDAGQSIVAALDVGRDLLVIRANEFKGRTSLDIRRFWDTGSEWAPSGKGVSIPAETAREFFDALEKHRPALLAALGVTAGK